MRGSKGKNPAEHQPETATRIEAEIPKAYCYNSCSVEKNLRQIRMLKDSGLLSQDAYEQRRKKLLGEE